MTDELRAEINEVKDEVASIAASLMTLVSTVDKQGQNIDRVTASIEKLSIKQARSEVDQGLPWKYLFATVGTVVTFGTIASALVVQHVEGQVSPLRDGITANNAQVERLLVSDKQLPVLDNRVAGNSIENETQHRWIADVINLENDFQERISAAYIEDDRLVIPPKGYYPLMHTGRN